VFSVRHMERSQVVVEICADLQFGTFLDRADCFHENEWRYPMGFGKGALLWLLGIPLPIIILLAIFMHH
jgi:hypothetical protein